MTATEPWLGAWVVERFGVTLHTGDASALPLPDLVGLALRRNPRRAHLLVSPVLGKHVPHDPRRVHGAGLQLGAAVETALAGRPATVLGYAETATGLGHAVADHLDAPYLHSTRRLVPGVAPLGGFEEEHSHATSHLLLPEDPALLVRDDVLVLVDDELSTGRTAANTIAELHALTPRRHYVVAALVELLTPQRRAAIDDLARTLGADIDVVALGSGRIELPEELAGRVAAELAARRVPDTSARPTGEVQRVPVPWPAGVRESGRHGFTAGDRVAARRAARATATALGEALRGDRVLVLGCEELMYAPTLIAAELADQRADGRRVLVSSTTRSPVHVVDEPGYPIRTGLTFPNHDGQAEAGGPRHAYNVAPALGGEPFTDVVLVVDDVADTPALHAPDGLVAQLARVADCVHLVVLPTYAPGGAR